MSFFADAKASENRFASGLSFKYAKLHNIKVLLFMYFSLMTFKMVFYNFMD